MVNSLCFRSSRVHVPFCTTSLHPPEACADSSPSSRNKPSDSSPAMTLNPPKPALSRPAVPLGSFPGLRIGCACVPFSDKCPAKHNGAKQQIFLTKWKCSFSQSQGILCFDWLKRKPTVLAGGSDSFFETASHCGQGSNRRSAVRSSTCRNIYC